MFPHLIMTWPLTNTNTDRSWSTRVKVRVRGWIWINDTHYVCGM